VRQPDLATRVVVSNPSKTRAIAEAKVKTDKVDARILAQLLAADFLPPVWLPDDRTRALRRQVTRRARLVRQRTRIKNQNGLPKRVPRGAPVPDGHTVCPATDAEPAEQQTDPRLFSYRIRMRSSRCTPATGERSEPGDTSPTSNPP
jgi:hypothetical protein